MPSLLELIDTLDKIKENDETIARLREPGDHLAEPAFTRKERMELEGRIEKAFAEVDVVSNRANTAYNLIQAFERNGLAIVEVATCQK